MAVMLCPHWAHAQTPKPFTDAVIEVGRQKDAFIALENALTAQMQCLDAVARSLPAGRACAESVGQALSRKTLDCGAAAGPESILACLDAVHDEVSAYSAPLRYCFDGLAESERNLNMCLANSSVLPATSAAYGNLSQAHRSIQAALEGLQLGLRQHLWQLEMDRAVVRGSQRQARLSPSVDAQGVAQDRTTALWAKADKLLYQWRAPRLARLALLSVQEAATDEGPQDSPYRTANMDPQRLHAFKHLEHEVTRACASNLAGYDAARAAQVCQFTEEVSLSDECRERAEDICEADEAMLSHEQRAVSFFEQCMGSHL
jgi:hypothetical protein